MKIKSLNLTHCLLLILLSALVTSGCAQTTGNLPESTPKNYSECVAAGYPALRSYPGKCIANGQTFIDESVPAPNFKAADRDQIAAICVDSCGDGECQEMVCMGSGCPCAETVDNCPQDCKIP